MHETKRYYGFNYTIASAIEEYESTSKSAAEIAQKYNICPSSIYYYRKQLHKVPRLEGGNLMQQTQTFKQITSSNMQNALKSRIEETKNILSKYNINNV